jgi:hypothetical protein
VKSIPTLLLTAVFNKLIFEFGDIETSDVFKSNKRISTSVRPDAGSGKFSHHQQTALTTILAVE